MKSQVLAFQFTSGAREVIRTASGFYTGTAEPAHPGVEVAEWPAQRPRPREGSSVLGPTQN